MVWCIIPEYDSIILPARGHRVQLRGHLFQEQSNHVAVGRSMSQAEPDLAVRVQRRYHRQSRSDSVEPGIAESFLVCPHIPYEARLVEPGLVDVYNASSLFEELQHLDSVLLPLDHDFGRVGVDVQLLGFYEAEAHVLLHGLPHELLAHDKIFAVLDCSYYVLSIPNGLAASIHELDLLSDGQSFSCHDFCMLFLLL